MKKIIFYFSNLLLILILVIGCREDVIKPEVFVENINEPVQIRETNSYSYFLSGKNFTSNLVIPAYINGNSSRVNITLVEYSSGYARIIIRDSEDSERYRNFINEDISMFTDVTAGYSPKTIEIKTVEFTGNLKIRISKNGF